MHLKNQMRSKEDYYRYIHKLRTPFYVFVFQEHWYMSYIDLLQRFELWNVSNEVIKLSTCSAITGLNQASTTLHINCSNCKRPMNTKGWICDR